MKTNPYIAKEEGYVIEIFFVYGGESNLVMTFPNNQQTSAAMVEGALNEAYNRGRLEELRDRKRQLNVDTQQLWKILDSLS